MTDIVQPPLFKPWTRRQFTAGLRKAGHERKRIRGVWSYRGIARKTPGQVVI